MGAHSTFEDHLKGVQAFLAPLSDDERDERHDKSSKHSKSSKHKDSSKHKKEKRKDKDKMKEKKSKQKKEKKRWATPDTEPSSSDDDIETQLEKGRAAVRITHEILEKQINLKQELRQLLWRIDQGEAVQITGIPDAWLRDALQQLFKNLGLASSSKGIFVKKQGASPCLQLLGPIISEARAAPISHSNPAPPASAPKAPAEDALPATSSAQPAVRSQPQQNGSQHVHAKAPVLEDGGGPLSAHAEVKEQPPPGDIAGDEVLTTTAEHPAAEIDMAEAEAGPAVAGPAMPAGWIAEDVPVSAELDDAGPEEGVPPGTRAAEDAAEDAMREEDDSAARPHRPAVGPARPPPELLAAAAEVHQAMMDEMDDYDELIGPAPPELLDEVEAAGDDDRAKEVVRIVKVLGAPKEGDAYAIMGLEPDAKGADVKKRYMRLSLLIHPDKCSHPQAQRAFQAVSKASKQLQDPEKRKALDGAREDAKMRERAEAAAAQEERERQWRMARGTATAEDLRGPIRVGPAQRDTWMTDLPEARRPNVAPQQVNVTTFSQRGIQERGDTRGWTETPQQKLLRLSAAEQARPQALKAAVQQQSSAAAEAVDAYNSSHRAKTLVEKHQEKLKEEKRQKKKRKAEEKQAAAAGKAAGAGGDADDSWKGVHPWRPFDRDKDLIAGPRLGDKDQLMKAAGNLTSRFGSKTGERSFL